MPSPLAAAVSPYLRQHAEDPVAWFAWGPDAFSSAREQQKPIFLSVGYAACHWCHVMHRESFADEATAKALNDGFVAIKVDREELPHVDEVYMSYIVATSGGGGWPMSVFLTPELRPFFGGTYFPAEARGGMPAFRDVLSEVARAWSEDRASVEFTAMGAHDYLGAMTAVPRPTELSAQIVGDAAHTVLRFADPVRGGFGAAPKFPQAPVTDFLLAYHNESDDDTALDAVEAALRAMVRGGIYDQAGGGIARYATDAAWLVPHFEKMLYDNAQLLSTLARLHGKRPCDEWAHAMRQTAEFLVRDLSAPAGGFCAALDADTGGIEGAPYVWTRDELAAFLSADELALAEDSLGVTAGGNWEGTTILTRADGRAGDAQAVDALLVRILEQRSLRPQPAVDTKVVTSWNALAARGLIAAGRVLADDSLMRAGLDTVAFLLDSAVDGEHVVHVVDDPAVAVVRLAEDYAGLVAACLDAHDATGDREFLARAISLHAEAQRLFVFHGAVWMIPSTTELPVRPRERHDGPTPTGAALMAANALRLSRLAEDPEQHSLARELLERLATDAAEFPLAHGTALEALVGLLGDEQA